MIFWKLRKIPFKWCFHTTFRLPYTNVTPPSHYRHTTSHYRHTTSHWWYHLKSLFLSFQKNIKYLIFDTQNSSYGSWKIPKIRLNGGGGGGVSFNCHNFSKIDPMSNINNLFLWFSESLEKYLSNGVSTLPSDYRTLTLHHRHTTSHYRHTIITLSSHHLKGLFLSFQKNMCVTDWQNES